MTLRGFILHFGAHKTGTSLIQKYLRDNETACREAKVFAMPRGDGDQYIGWGQKDRIDNGIEDLRSQVAAAVDGGAEYYVLSHENTLGRPFRKDAEHIYPSAKANMARFRDAAGSQPYRVVYYIRDQAAFLESYYLQTIHEGKWHSFDNFLKGIDTKAISWRPLYNAFCETFGPENVALRSFDDDIKEGQSAFLRQFLQSATVADLGPFKDFGYKPVRNPSISGKGLGLAQAINPLLESSAERKLVRRFLQANFSNRQFPRPELLTPEKKKEISDFYREENRDLVKSATAAVGAANG